MLPSLWAPHPRFVCETKRLGQRVFKAPCRSDFLWSHELSLPGLWRPAAWKTQKNGKRPERYFFTLEYHSLNTHCAALWSPRNEDLTRKVSPFLHPDPWNPEKVCLPFQRDITPCLSLSCSPAPILTSLSGFSFWLAFSLTGRGGDAWFKSPLCRKVQPFLSASLFFF